jgi:hypothetical protein
VMGDATASRPAVSIAISRFMTGRPSQDQPNVKQ